MTKLDQDELALRMLEAATNMVRPKGLAPTECLQKINPQIVAGWQRAAAQAIAYFAECVGPLDALPQPVSPVEKAITKINGRG